MDYGNPNQKLHHNIDPLYCMQAFEVTPTSSSTSAPELSKLDSCITDLSNGLEHPAMGTQKAMGFVAPSGNTKPVASSSGSSDNSTGGMSADASIALGVVTAILGSIVIALAILVVRLRSAESALSKYSSTEL